MLIHWKRKEIRDITDDLKLYSGDYAWKNHLKQKSFPVITDR